jgi:hypothetical protein
MKDSEFILPPKGSFGSPVHGQHSQQSSAPQGMGGMGDLPEYMPYRTLRKQAVGPLNAPSEISDNCLQYLCYLMERMLKKFAWYPRNGFSFIATSGPGIAVPAGGTSTIVTFSVPQDKKGVLMKVGWDCNPAPAFNAVVWSLLINGAAHPYFNNLTLAASNLSNADEFVVPLGFGTTVQLVATNANLGAVTLNGIMRGFIIYEQEP